MSERNDDPTVRRGGSTNPPDWPAEPSQNYDPTQRSPEGGYQDDPTRAAPGTRGRPVDRTVRYETPANVWGWLIVIEGDRRGQVYALNEELTDIGRGSGNNIVIRDEKTSEQHARVRVDDDKQFVLWDLASTNGTFVNDEQIIAATPLSENDRIKIGNTVMILKTIDPK